MIYIFDYEVRKTRKLFTEQNYWNHIKTRFKISANCRKFKRYFSSNQTAYVQFKN